MIKVLQFLFIGHAHIWDILRAVHLDDGDTGAIGQRYHLQCKICGNVKKKDLI